jgi:hypothetical protein
MCAVLRAFGAVSRNRFSILASGHWCLSPLNQRNSIGHAIVRVSVVAPWGMRFAVSGLAHRRVKPA